MNKERLLKLADAIEQDHYKFNGIHALFDIGGYFYTVIWSENDESKEFLHGVYIASNNRPGTEEIKHLCNTTACIAGFACLLYDYDMVVKKGFYNYHQTATELLDLTPTQASKLFVSAAAYDITGAEAAKVIRNLAETGKVDWHIIDSVKEYQ